MDWNCVEGNWKQMKGKIKEKWGNLTDDDLTAINGKRDQLEGKFQERYGLAKDQAKKDVDDWYDDADVVTELCSGPNSHFVSRVGSCEPFPALTALGCWLRLGGALSLAPGQFGEGTSCARAAKCAPATSTWSTPTAMSSFATPARWGLKRDRILSGWDHAIHRA